MGIDFLLSVYRSKVVLAIVFIPGGHCIKFSKVLLSLSAALLLGALLLMH